MSRMIVACKTLKNELNTAMAVCGYSYEIRWIESGLHNFPKKLHNTLQDILDQCAGCDEVLLVMGVCGNSESGRMVLNWLSPALMTVFPSFWVPPPSEDTALSAAAPIL